MREQHARMVDHATRAWGSMRIFGRIGHNPLEVLREVTDDEVAASQRTREIVTQSLGVDAMADAVARAFDNVRTESGPLDDVEADRALLKLASGLLRTVAEKKHAEIEFKSDIYGTRAVITGFSREPKP